MPAEAFRTCRAHATMKFASMLMRHESHSSSTMFAAEVAIFRVYRSKKSQLMFPLLAVVSGGVLAALVVTSAHATALSTAARGAMVAQDDEGTSDEETIPSDQVDKYI